MMMDDSILRLSTNGAELRISEIDLLILKAG